MCTLPFTRRRARIFSTLYVVWVFFGDFFFGVVFRDLFAIMRSEYGVERKQMVSWGGLGLQLRRSLLRECKTEQDEKKEADTVFLLLLVERMGAEFAAAKGNSPAVSPAVTVGVQCSGCVQWLLCIFRMDQQILLRLIIILLIRIFFIIYLYMIDRIQSPYSSQIERETKKSIQMLLNYIVFF